MSRSPRSAHVGALCAAYVLTLAACGDGQKARKLGMTCEETADCVEGICGGGICIDPTGDDDGDQLTNEFEVGLGTNPVNADTDNDGAGDKEELSNLSLVDIDGDTVPDALESRTADADGDCLPDQYDPQNHVSNDDLTGLIPIECRITGVCSDMKNLRVLCDRGRGAQSATCDYSNVPSFEATEVACDGLDNDCDGVTDDGAPDLDADALADCVDPDDDGDDIADADDDCPLIADADQVDSDGDALGDACDPPRPPVVGGIAPASPSNVTTPTLTGLADPNAHVSVFEDTGCATELATVTADPSGQFTVPVTVTGEGLHRHYLRAENTATLRSACLPSGLPYVLDTIAPAPPVFTKATPPSPSTDATPFIEGTAEAGARVTIGLGDQTFSATADASGTWAATVAIDAPGDWPFSGSATDAAGNTSALVSLFVYSLRSDAPAPPYLSGSPFSPPSPSNAPNPRVAITLCAPAGTRVAFWSGGCGAELLGEVDAVSDVPCPTGTGVVVTLADVGLPTDATTTVFAQSLGVGELVSACVPVGAYVDDTVAPVAPALVAADPTGPFAIGLAHMLLTVAPDSNVRIFAGACNGSPLLTTWTGPNATLDVRFAVPKNTSTATFGQATDLAGNTSACAALATFVHDDHAPVTPTPHMPAFVPGSPSRLSSHPQVTWCQGPDDACSVSVQGEFVGLPIAGSAPRLDATCPAGHAASATVDVAENRATPFVVTCHTPAGVLSPSVYVGTFVHDTTPPAAPSRVTSDPASPSAARAIRLVAATEAGARVVLTTDGGCLGLAVADSTAGADGRVTLAFDAPPQVTTTFYGQATDAAGNASACVSLLTFLHDDRVPATPAAASPPWTPSPPSGQTTAPALRVCVQPDLVTELFAGLGCAGRVLPLSPAVADGTCATGASATGAVPVLANAATRAFGQTVGPTGVRSACVFLAEYTHDDRRPADPVLITINPQSPASERDVQVTFTTTAGDAGALYTDPSCAGAALCSSVDGDRNGSIELHCVMPANATTPLFARASDLAGNLSACVGAGAFTHDDRIPEAPIRRAVSFAPPSPSNTAQAPTLFVCTQSSYALQVFSGAGCTGLPFALGAPSPDASCASGVSANGSVNVVHNAKTLFFARHVSATNVPSACVLVDGFVHDDRPPANPGFLSLQPGSPSSVADVRLAMTVEPGAALAVYGATGSSGCDGVPLAQVAAQSGNEVTLAFAAPKNVTTTFYARATDGAGNASACVSLATFTHDDRVPAAPTAHPTPFAPASPSSAPTPTVRACAGGTASVQVYAGLGCSGVFATATPVADASCPSPGLGVALTMNATGNGKTNFFARAMTPTGLASSCEYLGEYVHDDKVPAPPALGAIDPPSPSATRTPAFKGTGEAGAKLVLSTSNTCAAAGAVQLVHLNGQWSLPFTVAANAQTLIYGQITDAAGNASACTLLTTYTHDSQAPASPRLLTAPLTPSADSSPAVAGCAENGVRVDLFTNKDCTGAAAHSDVADASDGACGAAERRFDGDVPVPANTTTELWAMASDAAGNRSNCVKLATYRHDNIVPAAPVGFEERWSSDTATEVTLHARALVEPSGRLRVKRLVAGTPTCAGATQLAEGVADASGKVKVAFTVPSTTTVQVFAEPLDEALNRGACAGPFTVVGPMTVRTELNSGGNPAAPDQKIMLQDPSGNLEQTTTMTANGGGNVTFLVHDGYTVTVAWLQNYAFRPNHMGNLQSYQAYQLQTYTTARPGDALTLRQPVLRSHTEFPTTGEATINITAYDPPNAAQEAYYLFTPGCGDRASVLGQGTPLTSTSFYLNQSPDCSTLVGQNYVTEIWVAVRSSSLGMGARAAPTAYARGTFTWPAGGCGGAPCGQLDLGEATHPWSTVFATSTLTLTNGGVTFLPVMANLEEFVETSDGERSLEYDTFGGNFGGGPFGSGPMLLIDAEESAEVEYVFIPGIASGSRVFVGKLFQNVVQGAQSLSMYVAQRPGDPPSAATIDLGTLLPLVYLANENDYSVAERPIYALTTDGESIEKADFVNALFTWRDDARLEFLEWRFAGRARDLTRMQLPVTDANPCPAGAANCNPAVEGGGANNRFKPSFFGTEQAAGGFSWFDLDAVPGSVEPGAAMNGFADAWTYFGTDLFELSLFHEDSQIDDVLPPTFTGRITAIGGGGGGGSGGGGGATTGP